MKVFTLTVLLSALTSVLAPTARAQSSGEDRSLAVITALLTHHFQPVGELSLAWSRPPPLDWPLEPRVELATVPSTLSPQLLVGVLVVDDAGNTVRHTLVLRAELWQEGWAPREPGQVGDPVAVDQLEVVRFDALRERRAMMADASLDLDYIRAVNPGRLLTWNDVRRRPLVRRGQAVEVLAVDGALAITLRAVALHDASHGQVVRVRNPDSRREFTAVVVAESRATVQF